jgi:hypothetical protein
VNWTMNLNASPAKTELAIDQKTPSILLVPVHSYTRVCSSSRYKPRQDRNSTAFVVDWSLRNTVDAAIAVVEIREGLGYPQKRGKSHLS